MKRSVLFLATVGAAFAFVAPTASAGSPFAVPAYADCDGYAGTIETTVRNTKAVFLNPHRQAPVGVTATAADGDGPRVGVVFGDVVDEVERTLRGQKPFDERGFDTTRCDITVPALLTTFYDVQVKIAP
jgi:hypothetical protein